MRLPIADCRSQVHYRLRVCCRALVCVLILAGGSRAIVAGEVIDRVLAVAAGNLIMLSDVTAALEFGLVPQGAAPDPVRETLSRLIDRAIILAEVDRYAPPEPDTDAVDRDLQAVRSGFPSPQAFDETLARVGVNERHLRETLRQNLRVRAYLDQRFSVAPPTDEEVGRYYREHQQEFSRNGAIVPFDQARQNVVEAVRTERRRMLVDDWVAGLRRRSEIVDMYRSKT
jgi:hypothetical protein